MHDPRARELQVSFALGLLPAAPESTSWRAIAQEGDVAIRHTAAGADTGQLRAAGVDLIVASADLAANEPREFEAYQRFGAPVLVLPNDDVPAQLRIVAAAFGLDARAANLVADLEWALDGFRPFRPVGSIAAFSCHGDGVLHLPAHRSPFASLLPWGSACRAHGSRNPRCRPRTWTRFPWARTGSASWTPT
ncbi:hypothetical protein [Amycolatopsis sp. H20-H5]|uniref:hypothetical protein n=1 Tax=Amycolatopsis sp. H20-H5 TaxID=3046309 RepID=UPI002DBA721F|nr:hypothetical protein [Amycolatopsis sp. H20-H5]MEC3980363.1 hypothetical protein [Amycolatopsis sp. H20-H5]